MALRHHGQLINGQALLSDHQIARKQAVTNVWNSRAKILGAIWTKDVLDVALILAEWAGDKDPNVKVDEYYLDTEILEIYLQHIEYQEYPELSLECTLPPDPEASLERFNALVAALRESRFDGFIEHAILDGENRYLSEEVRREF